MTSILRYGNSLGRFLLRCASLIILLWFSVTGRAFSQDQPASSPPSTPATPSTDAPVASAPASSSTQDGAAKKTEANSNAEISQIDSATTFKVRVNLVLVRVVVRDSAGKAIGDLKREDFLLYDQNKLQTISNFSVETATTRQQRAEAAAKTQTNTDASTATPAVALPERFVALVFDDAHLHIEDATFARSQAESFLDSTGPADRVAIYTTSGQTTQEFTADKALLHKAILGIVPRPKMPEPVGAACPDVNHYMADLIENQQDSQALGVVVEETIQCAFQGDESKRAQATPLAESAARQALFNGDTENQFTYRYLEDALRRLSGMPGERLMLLVSPGFLLTTSYLDESGIIDRANRSNITINTLDARGLYAPDVMGDVSKPYADTPRTAGYKTLYRVSEQRDNENVLRDFAAGTGGMFFHNSNDLQGGIKRAGLAPEVSYILAFSPQNRKIDGRYHTLKVELASKKLKYSIQARNGYYAEAKAKDPQEQAKQEIQEAIYSQDEIQELPLDLQTQYFKGETDARLSVVSRLEVKGIHFRKADGRNIDDLTLATAIFDENGNFVIGGEKTVKMKLLDTTYDRLSRSGLTVKSSFSVKPGRYLVRQVVRDSEGAQMAARNGAVEIPN